MTTRQTEDHDLDRLMRQWMDDEATVYEPADLADRILAGTRRSRQLPAWLIFDRWIQMQLTMRRATAPRLTPLLLLLGLLIAALLAALVYVGSRPKVPPPFGVAANGRIAFLSDNQLYSVEPDGSGVLQLTNDPFGAAMPVFSHDGTRVAYKRLSANNPPDDRTLYGDLVVANTDGSNPIAIETGVIGMSPTAWSPDDREVLWTGTTIPDAPEQVFIAPADGSSAPWSVGDPSTSNWGPNWSPDGSKIAYVSDTDYYVMNRDGTEIQNVSQGSYAEMSGGGWNPDGNGLIFEAGREGDHDLWLVGLDGQPESVLAKSPQTEELAGLLARRQVGGIPAVRSRFPFRTGGGDRGRWYRRAKAALRVWLRRSHVVARRDALARRWVQSRPRDGAGSLRLRRAARPRPPRSAAVLGRAIRTPSVAAPRAMTKESLNASHHPSVDGASAPRSRAVDRPAPAFRQRHHAWT